MVNITDEKIEEEVEINAEGAIEVYHLDINSIAKSNIPLAITISTKLKDNVAELSTVISVIKDDLNKSLLSGDKLAFQDTMISVLDKVKDLSIKHVNDKSFGILSQISKFADEMKDMSTFAKIASVTNIMNMLLNS